VAHGQESHTWSYPEEAIRNYARNYAEATERLTGSTERLSEIADITVRPVTKDRIDDWLRSVTVIRPLVPLLAQGGPTWRRR
jgi:hypothetical protein